VRRRDPGPTRWTDAPPTANTIVKEQLVNHSYRTRRLGAASGWDPSPGWGQPASWSPLIDSGPLPLRAASSVARWWWPALATGGFLAVAGFVLGHDDPTPGLSQRGLLTITLTAAVVVLLTLRRAAGPGPLARAMAEYTLVALLAVLLATTGLPLAPPPPGATQASVAPDRRPALVKTLDGFRDWLATWWQWANQEYDRRTSPPSTTTPSQRRALAPSPAPAAIASTRRLW
jgi:hypothetical protein